MLQESFPVFHGYTLLQDSARAFLMDFIIPHNVGFSSFTYTIGLIPIDREDAMSYIVDEFLRPVWVRAYDLGDGKYARLAERLSYNFLVCRGFCELIEEHAA